MFCNVQFMDCCDCLTLVPWYPCPLVPYILLVPWYPCPLVPYIFLVPWYPCPLSPGPAVGYIRK